MLVRVRMERTNCEMSVVAARHDRSCSRLQLAIEIYLQVFCATKQLERAERLLLSLGVFNVFERNIYGQ